MYYNYPEMLIIIVIVNNIQFTKNFMCSKYCGISAQSKNCGVRETAVARERI
jgi:hypothetical protein